MNCVQMAYKREKITSTIIVINSLCTLRWLALNDTAIVDEQILP